MSFKIVEQTTPRINRCELSVPGINPRMLEKGAASDADVVFMDLEDSVPPDDKPEARQNVIEALNTLDFGKKTVSVRINGLDTHFAYRDIIDVLEKTGDRIDLMMIPKVGTPSDVYAVDMLVTQVEQAMGRTKRIGLELIIETAQGMMNVDEIAAASPRLESLHFGVADYSASTQARTTEVGGANPNYAVLTTADENGNRETHWGDPWHYPMSRIIIAARANGLRAIDGPFGAFNDQEEFRAQGLRAQSLGFEGKWAIHPSQIPEAIAIFNPLEADVARARRIMEAMTESLKKGSGAAVVDGRMVDIASVRQAEALLKQVEMIEAS